MAKTLKRIDAGGIQVAALYNRCSGHEPIKVRQAKRQASSAAQRRMNQIYSYQQLELRLAVNFPTPGSGLFVTLTYDDDHMPGSRKETQLRFKYFLKKLRDARKKAGLPDPIVFWTPEILSSASGRWHVHVVMDNTGRDYETIRACWIYGSEIDIRKLDARESDRDLSPLHSSEADEPGNYYRAVARYMTKELRECQEYDARVGLHGWSCTRNAKKPEIETTTVPDDFELEAPEGSTVILDEQRTTEWASWRVIKYRFGGSAHKTAQKARRHRRRKL